MAPAATFSVISNADSGPGSLRQAILDANASAGADTVTFALPANSTTIAVQNALPKITDTVLIDGYTQDKVKLIGTDEAIGFEIDAIAVVIRGITIEHFEQGIRISDILP